MKFSLKKYFLNIFLTWGSDPRMKKEFLVARAPFILKILFISCRWSTPLIIEILFLPPTYLYINRILENVYIYLSLSFCLIYLGLCVYFWSTLKWMGRARPIINLRPSTVPVAGVPWWLVCCQPLVRRSDTINSDFFPYSTLRQALRFQKCDTKAFRRSTRGGLRLLCTKRRGWPLAFK